MVLLTTLIPATTATYYTQKNDAFKCRLRVISNNLQIMGEAPWVTPERLDPDKISITSNSTRDSNLGYERFKILYQYSQDSEPRDLIVTVPKTPNAYLKCRGVKKDVFVQGDKRIITNRYGSQLLLNSDNEYHKALYQAFIIIKSKIEELTGSVASFPVRDQSSYTVLYTNLIHSNDGRMFSTAYRADEQMDILDIHSCVVRPALLLSMLKKSSAEVKVRVQLSQMYVHEIIKEFPLAHID